MSIINVSTKILLNWSDSHVVTELQKHINIWNNFYYVACTNCFFFREKNNNIKQKNIKNKNKIHYTWEYFSGTNTYQINILTKADEKFYLDFLIDSSFQRVIRFKNVLPIKGENDIGIYTVTDGKNFW